MDTNSVLVVGATGQIGAPVARQLCQDGWQVRVLARNSERARAMLGSQFSYYLGDVGDPAAVERAIDGCDAVHISLGGGATPEEVDRVEHQGTAMIAAAAARAGVSRITYMSGMHAAKEFMAEAPEHRAKVLAQAVIEQSGVPYTIFKPSYFMDNLPRHIQGRRAIVLGMRPPPLHMVAAQEFAQKVALALRTPEAARREFFVHGPEALTIAEALRVYCAVVEPDKRVMLMPLWFMAGIDRLFLGGSLRRTIQLMDLLQRTGERGSSAEMDHILGPMTTTVRQWCEQQRTCPTHEQP